MAYTLKQAFKDAKTKWEYLVKISEGGCVELYYDKLRFEYPELSILKADCGFCELFCSLNNGCPGCPLKKAEGSGNPFTCIQAFRDYRNAPTKENAKRVLAMIVLAEKQTMKPRRKIKGEKICSEITNK